MGLLEKAFRPAERCLLRSALKLQSSCNTSTTRLQGRRTSFCGCSSSPETHFLIAPASRILGVKLLESSGDGAPGSNTSSLLMLFAGLGLTFGFSASAACDASQVAETLEHGHHHPHKVGGHRPHQIQSHHEFSTCRTPRFADLTEILVLDVQLP
jgi:hypothetical protein